MLNIHSEVTSNLSENPFYAQVTLFRGRTSDYLGIKSNVYDPEQCMVDYLPGVATAF